MLLLMLIHLIVMIEMTACHQERKRGAVFPLFLSVSVTVSVID